MRIARTSFRISFTGGGSDIKEYYEREPGAVLSATIDKYIYLSMHPSFNSNEFHLKYSDNEMVYSLEMIKHPIIKQVFSDYLIEGVDFNSSADVPSGTGLGSSSSFTVGLINLCNAYKNIFISKEDIAKEACDIEIKKLKAPIGKQDQYAAAYGGMNFIKFNTDGSVCVEKIRLSEKKKTDLENSLMLFYTAGSRMAASVLGKQCQKSGENFRTLKKMANLSNTLLHELKNDSIADFGKILNENWQYKKELADNITNPAIDNYYNIAMNNGCQGGKLLGAGSCGFLLLFVPKHRQEQIRRLLGLYQMPFKFEDSGTTIIY
jgi:D-glycero-alpha-D-manno-heptose-7-phosphate kinase